MTLPYPFDHRPPGTTISKLVRYYSNPPRFFLHGGVFCTCKFVARPAFPVFHDATPETVAGMTVVGAEVSDLPSGMPAFMFRYGSEVLYRDRLGYLWGHLPKECPNRLGQHSHPYQAAQTG